MKRSVVMGLLAGAGAVALTTAFASANASPESLLPPGFDDPAPAPSPRPAPRPVMPSAQGVPSAPSGGPVPVIQSIPGGDEGAITGPISLPAGLPTLEELEKLDPAELDELLGLKPKFDMPPGARRSMEQVGLLDASEGGMPVGSLGSQPASLVRASLNGLKTPMVSRWGHILVRRALVSRLEAPSGMAPAEFAGLRVRALNAMGEFEAARGIAQDVDVGNWNETLADAAVGAFIATGDITGSCPVVRFRAALRDDAQWQMLGAICNAFAGESARARSDLIRMRNQNKAPAIDILLAQRYAGAAGRGRSAVNLEWKGVEELKPWRYGLSLALGAEIPDGLTENLGTYYQRVAAKNPALPVADRMGAAERAAREGIFSSRALVDLYGQFYAENGTDGAWGPLAAQLRNAYVATDPAERLTAIKAVWENETPDFARLVLTAHAAARLPASDALSDDAGTLIASMLAAGLDKDALEWGEVVQEGSPGWAQLVLAQPTRTGPVGNGAIDSFIDDDTSSAQRKSAFLVAGLAGLGRLESGAANSYSQSLGMELGRKSRWSSMITRAGQLRNQPLVSFLAGVGMQGEGWDKMTPRHLFYIVRALNNAGMAAEARMIAAEAVARG
jgi:hypothetical protein